jgi:hypothetical protein
MFIGLRTKFHVHMLSYNGTVIDIKLKAEENVYTITVLF